jgi:hypothetical protein
VVDGPTTDGTTTFGTTTPSIELLFNAAIDDADFNKFRY